MHDLAELLNLEEPAIDAIRQWVKDAASPCVLLPPSQNRDEVLLEVQVTTRSTMGAIVYETGGIIVDGGWLRFLGSGHPQLSRTLPSWNAGRSDRFYLIADDAAGGFFALNGGAFDGEIKTVHYMAPDSLEWMPLGLGYTDFFIWSLSEQLAEFYSDLRWEGWKQEISRLSGDRCFNFYPPLWTKEGSLSSSNRREIPIEEAFGFKIDTLRVLRK